MHLAFRCQVLLLLQHLQKLCLVDFNFGPLLLLADLLEVGNIFVEVLLFLPHAQESPPLIVLTQLDAGVPFGGHSDEFILEQPNEPPL